MLVHVTHDGTHTNLITINNLLPVFICVTMAEEKKVVMRKAIRMNLARYHISLMNPPLRGWEIMCMGLSREPSGAVERRGGDRGRKGRGEGGKGEREEGGKEGR